MDVAYPAAGRTAVATTPRPAANLRVRLRPGCQPDPVIENTTT